MYIKYGSKYIMKHGQQNMLSNETKTPTLIPKCHLKASKDCFRNDGVSNLIFKEKNGVIDELQERDL